MSVDECWDWTGRIGSEGYGVVNKNVFAHRLSYEMFVGPIPDGLQIDHLCRNRRCWNPDHLEAVTARENILRGVGPTAVNARKTHCATGHIFDAENTYLRRRGDRVERTCRACRARRLREMRARP